MVVVRWGIPLAIVIAGIWVRPTNEGVGDALIGAAVCLVVASVLMRIGFAGDRERADEEAARRFFDEHGRWPDEPA